MKKRYSGFILPFIYFTLCLSTFFKDIYAQPVSDRASFSNEIREPLRKTTWSDMVPHTMKGDFYNEFYIYHIFLENDLHLHMTISLANFGRFKSAVSGGKLFVSNFKGRNYNVAREFSQEYFKIDESRGLIQPHPKENIFVKGKLPETHRIHYETTKDNVSYFVDLEFHDIYQGYTRDEGIIRMDKDEIGIFIHIPKAHVSGRVAIQQDTLEVTGTAYMDHTYKTDLSPKISDKGFRHISHTSDGFLNGYYLIPKNSSDKKVMGLSVDYRNQKVQLEIPESIYIVRNESINGVSVPEIIDINYQSGNSQRLERTVNFQGISFLQEVSGLQRRIARSFLGGEVIEYVGKARLKNGIKANYNIFLVD